MRRTEFLVSSSVVGWTSRRGVPHSGPGVRLQRFEQPRARILGFPDPFCQVGLEGLELNQSVLEYRSGLIHVVLPAEDGRHENGSAA